MSSFIDDETQEAVEETRDRRREAFEAGQKKSRAASISTPEPTPRERSQKTGGKSEKNG